LNLALSSETPRGNRKKNISSFPRRVGSTDLPLDDDNSYVLGGLYWYEEDGGGDGLGGLEEDFELMGDDGDGEDNAEREEGDSERDMRVGEGTGMSSSEEESIIFSADLGVLDSWAMPRNFGPREKVIGVVAKKILGGRF
jgi:hypothetical protein